MMIEQQIFLVCVGVGVFLLAFFNRQATLYLIILAMALSPDISIFDIPARAEDLLMAPLAAGWLAHLSVFKDRRRTPLDGLLMAYFAVGVLATLWGAYIGTAHLFTADKDTSAPFHLLKRLEFVLIFLIMADALGTLKEVRRFTYVMIASMVALNVYAFQQFLANGSMALGPRGVTGHEAGVASLIAVPMALSLIPAARPPAKLLLGALVLFSLAVLPLSLGRNFLAVLGLILLYLGVFQRQRWVLVLPIVFLLGLNLYPSHVAQRVLSLQQAVQEDIPNRQDPRGALVVARASAPGFFGGLAIARSPVLGFGLASKPLGNIDSEYGVQLVYTGLVGLAIFLILGVRLIRLAKEIIVAARDPIDVGMARGFQLVVAAYALYSVFASSISPTHTGEFFFVTVALLATLHRSVVGSFVEIRHNRPEFDSSTPIRWSAEGAKTFV